MVFPVVYSVENLVLKEARVFFKLALFSASRYCELHGQCLLEV